MNKKNITNLAAGVFVLMTASASVSAALVSYDNENDWQAAVGTWDSLDFEDGSLSDANISLNDYNGGSPHLTDNSGTAYNNFPRSGVNSLFTVPVWNAGGGGWSADFNSPVQSFAFWSYDVQLSNPLYLNSSLNSLISVFDSNDGLIGSYDLFNDGGGHGQGLYGFNGFVSESMDIARVTLEIDSLDAIWFDDFQYSSASSPSAIPEPNALLLFGSGLLGLVGVRIQRKKKSFDSPVFFSR